MKTIFLTSCLLLIPGCNTHHTIVIDQAKPIDININVNMHLDLVVKDARQNLEQISGEKPTNIVRPEDIGLPAGPGASALPLESILQEDDSAAIFPVLFTHHPLRDAVARLVPIVASDDVKKTMTARHAKVQALWDEKLVGESHTGLLVSKGKLNAEQQTLINEENTDRTTLYAAEAKAKGATLDDVTKGYYIARLGYAKTGAWYEKYNQASRQWEWKQWGN